MKTINVLVFYALFNLFIATYSMEISEKVYWLQTIDTKNIFTSEKKIVPIGLQEASYSSYIGVLREIGIPSQIPVENLWEYLSTDMLFKKKDIKLFKKLLHKPNLYHTLKNQEYYQALLIAEKFKAPLLYAELIGAKLPKKAMTLITQQYMCLHNMPYALINKIRHKEIMELLCNYKKELYINWQQLCNKRVQEALIRRNIILEDYVTWSEELEISFNSLMEKATLPQALLLSFICNAPKSSHITMKLVSSMPGFNAFISLLRNDKELILYNLPITAEYKKKPGHTKIITALKFKV